MARHWTQGDAPARALEYAAEWRRRCWDQESSILSTANLWTYENAQELVRCFVQQPIEGGDLSFRGPEQQSQTHNEKILRIPHLPLSRTRPLSLTWQITGAGINPRFFLTNLKFKLLFCICTRRKSAGVISLIDNSTKFAEFATR